MLGMSKINDSLAGRKRRVGPVATEGQLGRGLHAQTPVYATCEEKG